MKLPTPRKLQEALALLPSNTNSITPQIQQLQVPPPVLRIDIPEPLPPQFTISTGDPEDEDDEELVGSPITATPSSGMMSAFTVSSALSLGGLHISSPLLDPSLFMPTGSVSPSRTTSPEYFSCPASPNFQVTVPLEPDTVPERGVSVPLAPATTQIFDLSDLDVLAIPILSFSAGVGCEKGVEEQEEEKNDTEEDGEERKGESEEESEEEEWAFFQDLLADDIPRDEFNLLEPQSSVQGEGNWGLEVR